MATHLVTGAGSGIGEALAQRLTDRGDDLVLLARNDVRAAEIAERFPAAVVHVVDLAGPLEPQLAALDLPASLDSVVHVAGVVELARVADLTSESFLHTLTVNAVAPAALTRWALPSLRAAHGVALFVSSTSALTANAEWSAYSASKQALGAVAEALRAEEAAHGVRVTVAYPSRTATPMQQRVRDAEGGAFEPDAYMHPETVADALLSVLDLPRDSSVHELVLRPTPAATRNGEN